MTETDVVRELRHQIHEAGGLKRWAHRVGVSERQARDAMYASRPPSPSILKALRLRRVVSYAPD